MGQNKDNNQLTEEVPYRWNQPRMQSPAELVCGVAGHKQDSTRPQLGEAVHGDLTDVRGRLPISVLGMTTLLVA